MRYLKNISFWAKSNPKKSRILIMVLHLLIAINAVALGVLFYVCDFGHANWLVWMIAIFSLVVYAMYPRNERKGQSSNSYGRRKILEFSAVLCCAFAISFGLSNFLAENFTQFNVSPLTSFNESVPSANFVVNKDIERSIAHNKNLESRSIGKFNKFKKQIRKDLLTLKGKKDRNTTAIKILGIIGVSGIIITLGFFVALIACHLSCIGYAAFSVIALVLGWGSLLYGGVIAVVDITNWTGTKKKEGATKKEKIKWIKRYAPLIIGVLLGLAGIILAYF